MGNDNFLNGLLKLMDVHKHFTAASFPAHNVDAVNVVTNIMHY